MAGNDLIQIDDQDIEIIDPTSAGAMVRAEIAQQVATARAYPRDVTTFGRNVKALVTMDDDTAAEMIYALPRGNKHVEGPSVRFAEVIFSEWGNARAGSRIIGENGEFITAQGMFHDLERNVARAVENSRRIVTSDGKRYSVDMIAQTANAAASIAIREAILKGIPKPHWMAGYLAARSVMIGDVRTVKDRFAKAVNAFKLVNVTEPEILALLDVKGEREITGEHLLRLRGLLQAIKDNDTTVDLAFRSVRGKKEAPQRDLGAKLRNGNGNGKPAEEPPAADKKKPAARKGKAKAGEWSKDEETLLMEIAKSLEQFSTRDEIMAAMTEFQGAVEHASDKVKKHIDGMIEARLSEIAKPDPKKGEGAAQLL